MQGRGLHGQRPLEPWRRKTCLAGGRAPRFCRDSTPSTSALSRCILSFERDKPRVLIPEPESSVIESIVYRDCEFMRQEAAVAAAWRYVQLENKGCAFPPLAWMRWRRERDGHPAVILLGVPRSTVFAYPQDTWGHSLGLRRGRLSDLHVAHTYTTRPRQARAHHTQPIARLAGVLADTSSVFA